ncbi:MAG: SH3 domain-containing protein [Turneriella sp.]|nr:SH3 domain-containing protein [Turneriella sp.]
MAEWFETYMRTRGKNNMATSLRMLSVQPHISVESANWLLDHMIAGRINDANSAASILKEKNIIGESISPVLAKINNCLQNCRVPIQSLAAKILQSKAAEMKPQETKAVLAALRKSLIKKQEILETIDSLFSGATALDSYRSYDPEFVNWLVTLDSHAIDECSLQIKLAGKNPQFGRQFIQRHKQHLSKEHNGVVAEPSPSPEPASVSSEEPSETPSRLNTQRGWIEANECVHLREEASIHSRIYGCFLPRTELTILEKSDITETHHGKTANWIKVKIKNQIGWIFGAFIKEH